MAEEVCPACSAGLHDQCHRQHGLPCYCRESFGTVDKPPCGVALPPALVDRDPADLGLEPMFDPGEEADDGPVVITTPGDGYQLVALGEIPLDGTWEILHNGCGSGPPSGVRFTYKHHLATCAVDSGALVLARPITLARLVDDLAAWIELLEHADDPAEKAACRVLLDAVAEIGPTLPGQGG